MMLRAEARDDVGIAAGLLQDMLHCALHPDASEAQQTRAFAGATLIAEALMRANANGG